MPEDRQRRHTWGEDGRVDPDDLVPDDEERAAGPEGPTTDVVIRALSVIPFLLLAALGLIGMVSWVLIVVLGVGGGEPIWDAAQGLPAGQLIREFLVALLIGLAPLGMVLGASWATARGFRQESSRIFWTVTQGLWGLAAVGLVYVWRLQQGWVDEFELTSTDWWFAFGVVAFAMILAGVRLRRVPRSVMDGR